MKRIIALCAAAALSAVSLTACTDPPDPNDTAATLVSDLRSGVITQTVTSHYGDPAAIYGDLADADRTITADPVVLSEDEKSATVDLHWTWDVDGREWSYATTATMDLSDGDQWVVQWDPTIVHRSARIASTFEVTRGSLGERAPIVSDTGAEIVMERDVFRIGVDKTFVTSTDEQQAAAIALAEGLGFDDPESYAATVRNAGERAFVEAIVIRQAEAENWNVEELRQIEGVNVVGDSRQLAPTAAFARPILGRVGEATAEIIEESEGRVARGDIVGISGLSKLYDAHLSGQPGVQVHLLVSEQPQLVFETEAVSGEALTVTLSIEHQLLAERVIAGVDGVAALAAVEPSTGRILASATTDAWNVSALGRYAPGSTFKVVTSLALLRSGLTPDSIVECPETITVDGRTFSNYSGFRHTGSVTLREALAHSCNTAFIGPASELDPADMASAALSLGIGQPGPWAFEYFSGSVPTDVNATSHAASAMGQGEVLASPLAMAVVAASVAAGTTVTPVFLPGEESPALDPATVALTEDEAAALAEMMSAVVEEGNSTILAPLGGVHAKTGTAELGEDGELTTNAWMIAYHGDLAVAVFVEGGASGIGAAGPLMEQFLSGARSLQ